MAEKRKVFIVEDDSSIREELAVILEDEGYEVRAFENGKVAFDFLSASHGVLPHCMIVDLMMPVMTGPELLKLIFSSPKLQNIPVVVATAKGSPGKELENLPSDILRIKKPFDLDELLETVQRLSTK